MFYFIFVYSYNKHNWMNSYKIRLCVSNDRIIGRWHIEFVLLVWLTVMVHCCWYPYSLACEFEGSNCDECSGMLCRAETKLYRVTSQTIIWIHFMLAVNLFKYFWCDFDRASSLICGNKMPTRCNRGFYCKITFYIFTARNTTGSNHCIILLSSWWWA